MARQIVTEIVGDASKFHKATSDAVNSSNKMAGAFKTVAAASAIVVGAIVAAGVGVYKLGSQFEAMDAKAKTVFGSQVGTVQGWAKANAAAMGLTSREAVGLAANLGDLLVPIGFTRKEAASMSTDIVGLSGALSEWTGGTKSASDIAVVLQKAMLGERDGLKELGISIMDSDVKQQMLKDGTDGLTGSARAHAVALATQTLLFEKSTDAQKAFADGTAVGLRSQAEMSAKMKEAGETIITGLYPAVSTIAVFLANNLPAAIKFAQEAFAKVRAVIEPIAAAVIPKLAVAFQFISTNVLPVLGKAFAWIGANVLPALGAAFGWIATNVIPVIRGAIDYVSVNILPKLAVAFNWISKNVLPALGQAFGWIVANVLPPVRAAIGFIVTNVIPPLVKAFGFIVENVIPAVGRAFAFMNNVVFPPFRTAIGIVVTVIGTIITAIEKVVGFLGGVGGRISSATRGMWDGIWNAFRSVINTLIRGWNSLRFTVPSIDMGPLGTIGGFSIGTPNIPYLHTGGIVPGTPGATVPILAQAGELVTSRLNSGGQEIHVHLEGSMIYGGPAGLDELALELARRLRLQGVT